MPVATPARDKGLGGMLRRMLDDNGVLSAVAVVGDSVGLLVKSAEQRRREREEKRRAELTAEAARQLNAAHDDERVLVLVSQLMRIWRQEDRRLRIAHGESISDDEEEEDDEAEEEKEEEEE